MHGVGVLGGGLVLQHPGLAREVGGRGVPARGLGVQLGGVDSGARSIQRARAIGSCGRGPRCAVHAGIVSARAPRFGDAGGDGRGVLTDIASGV